MGVSIAQLSAEHHHNGFGIFNSQPRLSWRFSHTLVRNWKQSSYEIIVTRNGKDELYQADSPQSLLVPWPSLPLLSRERVKVKVRAAAVDGSTSNWASLDLEAALLNQSDWLAKLISNPHHVLGPKRPYLVRKVFENPSSSFMVARLYATAHGVYEVEINGQRVGDELLAPGWQAYSHRLHYQTYDVTTLLQGGCNVIGAHIAEGWFSTRIGRPGVGNQWGERPAFLAQLEVNGIVICATDSSWECLNGPIIQSELYNGEIYDSNQSDLTWCTVGTTAVGIGPAEELPFPTAELIAPEVAPVKRVMEIKPIRIVDTPTGRKILDFGQNMVGWLRIEKDFGGTKDDTLLIRHAEVTENGELGTRPLRSAKAEFVVKLGGPTKGLEAKFTFFGFRSVSVLARGTLG
jgi:alpha-L-rhamnosidase